MFSTYGQGVQNEPQVQPWVLRRYCRNWREQVKEFSPSYLQVVSDLSKPEEE